MDELFKKIFESKVMAEVLTEETRDELKKTLDAFIVEAVNEAKEKAEIDAKAQIAEQFVNDKNSLIEALDTKVEEYLREHFEELNEDIVRHRDLEVEYAQKLVEARAELAENVKADMAQLIEDMDAFFELRLDEEIEELREGIEDARKNQFGKKLFEAFSKEFRTKFREEDKTFLELEESKNELDSTKKALQEATKELNSIKRDTVMNRVLEPLEGKSREVMEAILATVPTNKLDETYKTYIGRVLHDSASKVESKAEKENGKSSVLAEGNTSTVGENNSEVKIVTGDKESLNENADIEQPKLSPQTRDWLKKMSGQ